MLNICTQAFACVPRISTCQRLTRPSGVPGGSCGRKSGVDRGYGDCLTEMSVMSQDRQGLGVCEWTGEREEWRYILAYCGCVNEEERERRKKKGRMTFSPTQFEILKPLIRKALQCPVTQEIETFPRVEQGYRPLYIRTREVHMSDTIRSPEQEFANSRNVERLSDIHTL